MKTLWGGKKIALAELRRSAPDTEFKPIAGFERYLVGNHGTIISTVTDRFLCQYSDGKGYPRISLGIDKRRIGVCIHRLVALAFVANPRGVDCVNHIDGVKTNNVWTNLEWCTNQENFEHAKRTGLLHSNERNVTREEIVSIRALAAEGKTSLEISMKFGIHRNHVYKIVNRKTWAWI